MRRIDLLGRKDNLSFSHMLAYGICILALTEYVLIWLRQLSIKTSVSYSRLVNHTHLDSQ